MKISSPTLSKSLTGTLCLGVALSSMTACGSSEPGEDGEAFLSIVGDRNVYLENGDRHELKVRYHDSKDQPLAGQIDFTIDGNARGARLLSQTASTDSNGVATVTLDASSDDQASFYVEASAADAGKTTFNITIEEPEEPLDPNGVYEVTSNFDVVSGLEEGTVRDVVHGVLDFTEDPGTFLLMLAAENFDFITEDHAEQYGPLLTVLLEQQAPDFIQDVLEFGENFAEVAQNFGVVSELTIDGRLDALSAEHALTGVVLAYGTQERTFTMSDMNVENIEAYSVEFQLEQDGREVNLGEHALPFTYGAMLRIGVEQVIIPLIDSEADDLRKFLENRIKCSEVVGPWLEENVPPIGDGMGATVCSLGVTYVANELMNLIEGLDDNGLELVVRGTARPVDTNNDSKPDVLLDGKWEGALEYAGRLSATIEAGKSTFRAERIGD